MEHEAIRRPGSGSVAVGGANCPVVVLVIVEISKVEADFGYTVSGEPGVAQVGFIANPNIIMGGVVGVRVIAFTPFKQRFQIPDSIGISWGEEVESLRSIVYIYGERPAVFTGI